MKYLLLISLLIGQFKPSIAQSSIHGNKAQRLKGDLDCSYQPKYSAAQRNHFYPFNLFDTVKLISFRYHFNESPIKGDSLLLDSLIEIKTLTKPEVSSLTDILYNNFYKRSPNYGTVTQCFFPRNAILFFDKSGKLQEYILICFHCDRHKESSDKIKYGDECTQKIEKIREFFVSKGLKFGTDKAVETYPGESFDD